MKKQLPLILAFLAFCFSALAQQNNVGINTDPDSSAALHVHSLNKGLLIPRLSSVQQLNIANPAPGLMVYNTDTESFWYRDSAQWVELSSVIWTRNGNDIFYSQGNVGIGTDNPQQKLDVRSHHPDTGAIIQTTNFDRTSFLKLFSGESGDPHPYLLWPNTSDLRLLVAKDTFISELMRVTSDGKLGIGTDTPAVELDVIGKVRIDQMDTDTMEETLVVRKSDGTLAEREISSIIPERHYIGELFGGGIVYWVDEFGKHGLIASLEDLDDGIGVPWSNMTGLAVGPGAQSFFDGAANTAAIIAQSGHSESAAKLCDEYTGGGLEDWYLPSHTELELLSDSRFIIDKILAADGDPDTNGLTITNTGAAGNYWSSTEDFSSNAWSMLLRFGNLFTNLKYNNFRVRAVRSF